MVAVIHALLQMGYGNSLDLEMTLDIGQSAWTVAREGLVRRVDFPTELGYQKRYKVRTPRPLSFAGPAWHEVYGRDPDASDAWDHAIKAVKAALVSYCPPDSR